MFHYVTGIPFGNELTAGAYDDLTMWEQIDDGAQYTPAKKWLFCVPVALYVAYPPHPIHPNLPPSFLASTHYTAYNPWVFAINVSALIFVLIPKLPQVRNRSLRPRHSGLADTPPLSYIGTAFAL